MHDDIVLQCAVTTRLVAQTIQRNFIPRGGEVTYIGDVPNEHPADTRLATVQMKMSGLSSLARRTADILRRCGEVSVVGARGVLDR